jgi:hypothetical protein
MTPSHTDILTQLAAGDISVDQAAAFLRSGGGRPAPAAEPRSLAGRWLHVRVTDLATGRQRVNVNVPLHWVVAGLKIGARYTPEIHGLDLEQLLTDIQAGASGRLVDVEDWEDGQRVEVFVD